MSATDLCTAEKPVRTAAAHDRKPEPCAIVIFGASGDLTHRKLVPALYNLHLDGLLPEGTSVVGVARRAIPDDAFVSGLERGVAEHSRRPLDPARWRELAERVTYLEGAFDDPAAYHRLGDRLAALDRERGRGGNRLYYLATPPSAFPLIARGLGEAGLSRPGPGGEWARLVIEKPYGRDLASACELNRIVNGSFPEQDVFRIDHYLGKETVQNLIVFRFANAIFEPLWNQKYLDHVQITVAESIGVESRGAYYEEAGITRDMVQNHLFQLLCLTAMEPPATLDADSIRDEKVKVLKSLRPLPADFAIRETVRAQYGAGSTDGSPVPGYREEPGVSPGSHSETFVALRLHLDNWRWAGVPFYLRAGKRLPKRATSITLQFRDVPHHLFRTEARDGIDPNSLTLAIQPDEGTSLRFGVKVPGTQPSIRPVAMDFRYGDTFGQEPPEAYERLILDAILGDSTLFIRRDEVEAAWSWIDPIEQGWAAEGGATPLPVYPAGSWGPPEADALLTAQGRAWRVP